MAKKYNLIFCGLGHSGCQPLNYSDSKFSDVPGSLETVIVIVTVIVSYLSSCIRLVKVNSSLLKTVTV